MEREINLENHWKVNHTCSITAIYNQYMKKLLTKSGIEVIEIPDWKTTVKLLVTLQ